MPRKLEHFLKLLNGLLMILHKLVHVSDLLIHKELLSVLLIAFANLLRLPIVNDSLLELPELHQRMTTEPQSIVIEFKTDTALLWLFGGWETLYKLDKCSPVLVEVFKFALRIHMRVGRLTESFSQELLDIRRLLRQRIRICGANTVKLNQWNLTLAVARPFPVTLISTAP